MSKGLRYFYILFCIAIAAVIWMLAYGAGLALLYGDSRVLQGTITASPFLPVRQFWVYWNNPALQIVAGLSALPALLVAGIVSFIGLRRVQNPLGNAAFQTIAELRHGGWFRKDGHILGRHGARILRVQDDRHHLVIGPTRSGKGAGYVIPNALMHRGSMIVTDLKGEIFRATAGYRRAHGSQVFLFSPGSEWTHSYNPLDFIRDQRGTRTTDIQNVASILVPENTQSEHSIWQATAQQVIAGAISYILESPFYEGRRNLGEVNSFFNSGRNLQALMSLIKENESYLSKFTMESFNSYLALSERAAASALLDIQKALRPFRNERIVAATSVTDMDLRAIRRRPISIYLAPNITDLTLVRPLITLFVQQVMDILTLDHDPHALPVYFLLDEFRQLKRMDEVMTKLPYVAGYGIKLAFVVQDLKSLDEIYGETSRHSLLGNCGYQLIFGANDQATADYVSRALGKRTIRYRSESRTLEMFGLNRRTKVEQIRERDLMMPQEVRQMPEYKMVLLVENQQPIFGNKLRFFKTDPFKSAEGFAATHVPEVPPIEFIPATAVPATTDQYAKVSAESGLTPASVSHVSRPNASPQLSLSESPPVAPRRARRTALSGTKNQTAGPRVREAGPDPGESEVVIEVSDRPNRIRPDMDYLLHKAEQRLSASESRIEALIADKQKEVTQSSPRRRKHYLDILTATIPDPIPDEAANGE